MKFQFFTVSALAPEQGQERLNQFCGRHRVVAVEKQLITQGSNSFWSVCVSYVEGAGEQAGKPLKDNAKRGRIDYKEALSEPDFAIYAQLRNLRKILAEQEGVPVYALFSNEQLAEMVTHRMISLSALAEIEGVGKARLDKYGASFIAELNRLFTSTPIATDEMLPHSNS